MSATDSRPAEQTEQFTVAQWAAAVFVVLVPIHGLYLDIGFSFKPWFLPLLIGLAAGFVGVVKAALGLPRVLQIGIALVAVGGVLGMLNSANQGSAVRHLIAIGIAVSVMVLLMSVERIPYLGVAVRTGALIMVTAVIVEALLVMPHWVAVETLETGTSYLGPLAEIAYGDIILVTGTHDDSNFSAMYAAVFLFLMLAFPAERWFNRRADGIMIGLLVVQLFLSLSKTGLLAVGVAIGVTYLFYRGARQWRNAKPSFAAGLIAFLGVGSVLLVVDATDGEHDIAHGLRKRGGQVLIEAEQAAGLATGGAVNADSRAAIWRRYGQDFLDNPLTGIGYGPRVAGYTYAHSAPLEAAAGAGVLGLAGWLAMWTAVALTLWRLVRARPETLPLVGVFGVVTMSSMFLSTNYEPIVGLVFGIILAPHLPRLVEPDHQ